MKQSTKLLRLLLAPLMTFSCISVIGSAALVQGEVKYDIIDDADISVSLFRFLFIQNHCAYLTSLCVKCFNFTSLTKNFYPQIL